MPWGPEEATGTIVLMGPGSGLVRRIERDRDGGGSAGRDLAPSGRVCCSRGSGAGPEAGPADQATLRLTCSRSYRYRLP